MTEIETTVKRVVRFDGKYCNENCDCHESAVSYHVCCLDINDEIVLINELNDRGNYARTLRCHDCISDFGLNGEEMKTKTAFTWADFENGKIAVKCETPKEFMRILENCKMLSMTWADGAEIDMGDTIDDNVWNAQKGDMCIYYNETGIDMASTLMLRNKNFGRIPSTSVPDLKYRPFRELKADLIGRVVSGKNFAYKFISNIETIVESVKDDDDGDYDYSEIMVKIDGMYYNANQLFEDFEFYDPKTGLTSPCGEVDCE